MSLTLSRKAMQVKPSSTLAITDKANQLRKAGVDVVGFGAGEPDFKTPDNICAAAIDAINSGFTKYTAASGILELKQAVCDKLERFNHLHYETNQIVISNGGKHSLSNIFDAIINPGDEVLIPCPYWLSYPEMVKLSDGIPVFLTATKENDYKITASQLEKAITDKTKALVLNSPNNPTGMIYSEEELRAIADVVVKKDIYVIADEMYEYLIYGDDRHVSIASFNEEIYKRTITCSGMSKSYAMTGWRIGYAAAPTAQLAKLMSSIQSHATSNPNSIAQRAALEALNGPQEAVEEMKKEFGRRRDYMVETLRKMPYIDFSEPKGAFYVFIDMTEALDLKYGGEKLDSISRLADALLEDYAVAVVPCTDFGCPNHIRLSYAISMEQIEKGLSRIAEFLGTLEA